MNGCTLIVLVMLKDFCNAVYNVVLTNGHSITANGYWAITLGHEYTVGILSHNYFGSKIIRILLVNQDGVLDVW